MQISVVWEYLVSCSCFDCGFKTKWVDSVHAGVCLVILQPKWIDIVLFIFWRNTNVNHWTFTLCLEYFSTVQKCLRAPWVELLAQAHEGWPWHLEELWSEKLGTAWFLESHITLLNDLSCFSLCWCVTTHRHPATLNSYNTYWLTVPHTM